MNDIRSLRWLVITLVIGLLLTTPTQGSAKWWDKFGEPKFGGTITIRTKETSTFVLDPYAAPSFNARQLWYDSLFMNEWTVNPDTYPFKAGFTPEELYPVPLRKAGNFPILFP